MMKMPCTKSAGLSFTSRSRIFIAPCRFDESIYDHTVCHVFNSRAA